MKAKTKNHYSLISVLTSLCLGQAAYSGDIDVLMDLALEDLLAVEVSTASKTEEKISDIPASVVVIGRAEIARYGYRNLAEILSSIPGLYGIEQYYYEGMAFGVRGFWSNWTNKQIIILVDGIPQINPHRNNYILPQIAVPVEAIERVEVVRGPLSVIYGDGAFFGAINIITDTKRIAKSNKKSNKKNKVNSQSMVSVGLGDYETGKLYGRVSGGNKNGDLHFTLTASHSSTDGIHADYEEMVEPGYLEGLRGMGFSGEPNTNGKLDNSENYVSLNAHAKDFAFHFSHVQTDNDAFIVFPGDLDGNHQTHKVTTLGVSYESQVTQALSLQARLNYRQTELLYDYYPTHFLHNGARAANEVRKGRVYEAELTGNYALSKNTRIIAGLAYRIMPEVTDFLDLPNAGLNADYYEVTDNITSNGLFAQVTHNFSKTFKLVAGARLERLANYTIRTRSLNDPASLDSTREYDKGSTEVIPRLAAIYRPSSKHGFKFLYGEAVSWPSFDQNQPQVVNPELNQLELESIKTLELVYDYIPSSTFSANLSIFHNEMENLIVRSLVFEGSQFSEIQNNLGELTTTGLESTLRYRPNKQWNLELSASYQRSDDKNSELDVPYSPKLLGYMKASYRFNKGRFTKGLTVAVDGYYTAAMQPSTNLDPNAAKPYIGEESDSYFNMGLNLRMEDRLFKGSFMNLRISNLLDEKIRYPVFTNNDWATRGYIGEGRRILFNIGMKF